MSEATTERAARRVSDFSHVLAALETLCASLHPGDRLPTHAALMRQFGASERAVLRALEELQRSGHIIRRNGVGTFVRERPGVSGHTLVAIAEPDRFHNGSMVAELFRCTESAGVSLVCRPLRSDAEHTQLPLAGPHPSHGYILFDYSLAPLAKRLHEAGCRVALVGAPPPSVVSEVPCFFGDEEHGGYLALRHLLDLGHRHVALWAGDHLRLTARWRGYQRALLDARRLNQHVEVSELSAGLVSKWRSGPQLAAEFFRSPAAPTAVAAWDDLEAVTLLSILARAGVRVPEEVSLVGCHALPESERVCPALTTVDHGFTHQIQAALRMLIGGVDTTPAHATVLIPTLIHRESTAQPPRQS